MSFLEIARACVARGWYVIPCYPETKNAAIKGGKGRGWRDSFNTERQVSNWWNARPDCNVAIACGPSVVTILDVDHGLKTYEDFLRFKELLGLPDTYTVHTGRRFNKDTGEPEYGVQMYFAGSVRSIDFMLADGCCGQVRSENHYVMSAGSIHPDSKEAYEVIMGNPDALAPIPDCVRTLEPIKLKPAEPGKPMEKIPEGAGRHAALTSLAGTLRNKGFDKDGILAQLIPANESMCEVPVSSEDLEHIADSVSRYPVPQPDPIAVIGGVKTEEPHEPVDWRTLFHTRDEVINCPPPTFLIDQFLARQAICAIAAPVAQRKSLIALNVARSLCTGEPLFGFLPVVNRPSRVLYLCPEMGLVSLSDRIRKIGVAECLGDTLFLRSMNMRTLELLDIPEAALEGSVLIIDTAIRFLKGDENSSKDMQLFSDTLFTIQRRQGRDGAIMALYHSPKATKDVSELTLENCMRGSGELGATITDAHGTRLQNPTDPYNSASFLRHVKCRDYKGVDDFEFSSDLATGVLTRSGDAGVRAVLSTNTGGNKANRDGLDEAAKAIIRANLDMTVPALIVKLREAGIDRKKSWVGNARMDIRGSGVRLTAG